MTDEEKIKDYDRLQYEYAQIHQEYRRLSERQTPTEANNNAETKQLIIGDVTRQSEQLFCKDCGTAFEYNWHVEYNDCPKCGNDIAK